MTILNDTNLTDLTTLKEWINIGNTDAAADNVLQGLIERASAVFLRLMARNCFVSQNIVETIPGNGLKRLFLKAQPVTAVSSIFKLNLTGVPLAINGWDYGYRIDPLGIYLFGDIFYTDEYYTISYTGGEAVTSPRALAAEQAVIALCTFWYKRKAHADEKSHALGAQVMTTYITTDVPEEVRMIANSLKKVI